MSRRASLTHRCVCARADLAPPSIDRAQGDGDSEQRDDPSEFHEDEAMADADDEESEGEEASGEEGARRGGIHRSKNARHLQRRNLERCLSLEGKVQYGYVSELYTSVRFASLSPAYKHATSVQVLLFFAQGIDASADGELPTANPPYLYTRGKKRVKAWRTKARFRPGAPPTKSVCSGGAGCSHDPPCRGAMASACPNGVPTRGRAAVDGAGDEGYEGDEGERRDTSPAALVIPALTRAIGRGGWSHVGTLPLEVAFYLDLVAWLRCVLEQYDGCSARRERCRREGLLLAFAVGRDLECGDVSRRAMDADKNLWFAELRRVALSKHLTAEVLAITDQLEVICKRILSVHPGESLAPELHALKALEATIVANPGAVLLLQKLWGRQVEPGYPLGRIHRPASEGRVKALAHERREKRRARRGVSRDGAAVSAGSGSDAEVSSASEAEEEVSHRAVAGGRMRARWQKGPGFREAARAGAAAAQGDDDEPTQPTQPLAHGVGLLLGAAAAAEVVECSYCHKSDGELWCCQLCGNAACHEACCADGAVAAFGGGCDGLGAAPPPRHVCRACVAHEQRALLFAGRSARDAVTRALNMAVHPLPLRDRTRCVAAAPAVLLAVQRAVGELADAAHSYIPLGQDVRDGALAARVLLGCLRIASLLRRDPTRSVTHARRLLGRLQKRGARLGAASGDGGDSREGLHALALRYLAGVSAAVAQAQAICDHDSGTGEDSGEEEDAVARQGGEHARCGEAHTGLREALRRVGVDTADQVLRCWLRDCLCTKLPLRRACVQRAFGRQAAAPAGQEAGGGAAAAAARGGGGGAAADADGVFEDDAGAAAGIANATGERRRRQDRSYRVWRSVHQLAELRVIGNSRSMYYYRQLQRVVTTFGGAPRAVRRTLARVGWGPSVNLEVKWLDAKADEYCSAEHDQRMRERYEGYYECTSTDNASVFRMTSPCLGFSTRAILSHYTAVGAAFWPRGYGASRTGTCGLLSSAVARWVVPTDKGSSRDTRAVAEVVPGGPCVFPPDGRCLPTKFTLAESAAFYALKALFVPFDGTLGDAARLLPGYLNLADTPSPLTEVRRRP